MHNRYFGYGRLKSRPQSKNYGKVGRRDPNWHTTDWLLYLNHKVVGKDHSLRPSHHHRRQAAGALTSFNRSSRCIVAVTASLGDKTSGARFQFGKTISCPARTTNRRPDRRRRWRSWTGTNEPRIHGSTAAAAAAVGILASPREPYTCGQLGLHYIALYQN